jgi:hypothetical protein
LENREVSLTAYPFIADRDEDEDGVVGDGFVESGEVWALIVGVGVDRLG